MEIEPEILPPAPREEKTYHKEVHVEWNVNKRVHPVVGFLLAVAGAALVVVMLFLFFWVALVLLAVGLVAVALRALLGAFSK